MKEFLLKELLVEIVESGEGHIGTFDITKSGVDHVLLSSIDSKSFTIKSGTHEVTVGFTIKDISNESE